MASLGPKRCSRKLKKKSENDPFCRIGKDQNWSVCPMDKWPLPTSSLALRTQVVGEI